MKINRLLFIGCLICLGATAASCSSNQSPEGTGSVSLDLISQTEFSTRSVNESDYKDVNGYTVQILNSSNVIKAEYVYRDLPVSFKLDNGSYKLKAFYGQDSDASRDKFYVEGITDFNVAGDSQNLTVNCAPVCGKTVVKFDSTMGDYFSDYSVEFETAALTAAGKVALWAKADTEPWYLKLNESGETVKATINVTRKSDSKSSTVEKTYSLKRNNSWTLSIAPKDNNGSLGISITIDESTNDQTVDIVVPSDWV